MILVFFMLEQKNLMEKFFSNGGRVLGVTSLGGSLNSAINNCYSTIEKNYLD